MRSYVFRSSGFSLTVPGIIFLNFLVYVMWQFSSMQDDSFMVQNFLVSWDGLLSGKVWTLLSSVYSHNSFWHFLINMYALKSFGSVVEPRVNQLVGRPKAFLHFYWIAGVVASLTHATVSAFFLNEPAMPALGASGSVAGVILLFSFLYPREKILIFGIIPIPALVGAFLVIGLDVWGLLAQYGGGGFPIGHGAHLGGAFTGILYYFFVLRKAKLKPPTQAAPSPRPTRPATDGVIDIDYKRLN